MKKLGNSAFGGVGSFSNTSLSQLLSAYRKTIASYIPAGTEDIDKRLGIPLLVSPKFDGELWYLLYDKEWLLVAPNGRTISGNIEILNEATKQKIDQSYVLAGELHVVSESRTRIADLTSMLGDAEKCDTSKLGFAVFDLVSSSDISAAGTTYSSRFEKINRLPSKGNLFVVPTEKTSSTDAVHSQFDNWVLDKKFEGLVARSDDARTYKVKPVTEFDAAILGFTEKRLDDGDYVVRTVLVGVQASDGSWIPLVPVGNIGDNNFRKELYSILKPSVIPSSYRKTSESSGVMYQFVNPQLVAEIKALDLQTEDTSGKKVRDPKLSIVEGQWRVSGWTNSVAVYNPTLVRLRNDKGVSSEETGWDQIVRLLPVEIATDEEKSGKSEVIQRRVWTKDESVRKLLVWKTNKEGVGFSSFVVHWTDYSPGRKAPLAREVRLAPSEKEAEKIAEDMITENIKKGWIESV
jgi:ATP-dependent DNA ligase